jgi:rhodanese-related sulfurtransferase
MPAQSGHYAHRAGANQLRPLLLELNYAHRILTKNLTMSSDSVKDILARAKQRAESMNLPYSGALLPREAHALMQQLPGAKLIDVRTQAEWDYVGRVPESVLIEWNTYPSGQRNPRFLEQLEARVPKTEAPVMFLCRSGARSHQAAAAATQAGYPNSFNVLEGFEGEKDPHGHRGTVGGWRFADLPWVQG